MEHREQKEKDVKLLLDIVNQQLKGYGLRACVSLTVMDIEKSTEGKLEAFALTSIPGFSSAEIAAHVEATLENFHRISDKHPEVMVIVLARTLAMLEKKKGKKPEEKTKEEKLKDAYDKLSSN